MARPRKASTVLELNGAFKKNPKRGRDRENEPEPVGDIGAAPGWFSAKQKACWAEIVDLCHAGSLCRADRLIVEHASLLLHQLRAEKWVVHPTILIRYESALGKLGLSPADRSKIKVPKAKPKNKFAELDA